MVRKRKPSKPPKEVSANGPDLTPIYGKKLEFPLKPAVEKAEPPLPLAEPKPLRPAGVPFRVFRTISGIRQEHIAGFANYVARHNLGPMPVPAWRVAYERFLQSPVN